MTPTAFHVMAKPTGPICNLDCQYCFYLEKERLYPAQTNWKMAPATLEAYVAQHIRSQSTDEITFAWQGGEPTLMGVDFFRQVVGLQTAYAGPKRISNALQTNGVLLDDEWCEFLAEQGFLVGISLDGPEEVHDLYRVDRGGHPTFQKVMRGLECLQKHGVEFNTLTVVSQANSRQPLEVYRFLKESGSQVMQFIPLVERFGNRSVQPEHYGEFLCKIFDEWVLHDVGTTFVQLFDITLESFMQLPQSLCIFRERCGEAMALEHNGDLYSCDHFVTPENKLGNILEQPLRSLVTSAQQQAFGKAKSDTLPRMCRECDVRFACHGECPKNRFARTPDGEEGLNYLCAGYLRFFRHVTPAMRFMANQLRLCQPPAQVMGYARELEGLFREAGRNDPCPCGSGGKYKKCCGRTR